MRFQNCDDHILYFPINEIHPVQKPQISENLIGRQPGLYDDGLNFDLSKKNEFYQHSWKKASQN